MAYENLALTIYPVGTMLFTTTSVSPADSFGGTWVQLTNCGFLRPANSFGTRGGNDSHSHMTGVSYFYGGGENRIDITDVTLATGSDYGGGSSAVITEGSGVGAKMEYWNNYSNGSARRIMSTMTATAIPTYTTVYCWYRTA